MYLQIIQNLLDTNPEPILNYAKFPRDKKAHQEYCYSLFAIDLNELREPFKLSNNLFITVGMDNWCKFRSLENLFDDYDISYDSLKIYL